MVYGLNMFYITLQHKNIYYVAHVEILIPKLMEKMLEHLLNQMILIGGSILQIFGLMHNFGII